MTYGAIPILGCGCDVKKNGPAMRAKPAVFRKNQARQEGRIL